MEQKLSKNHVSDVQIFDQVTHWDLTVLCFKSTGTQNVVPEVIAFTAKDKSISAWK